MQYRGNIIDIQNRRIFPGIVAVENGKIASITESPVDKSCYILPGFIDAHVHIESSMLTPAEFGRIALSHGTVATISDPHEIANVLGVEGVRFMLENAKLTPLKIHFGAPSCVPASPFETAGAAFGLEEIKTLLERPDIYYLSEVMNFPAVIAGEAFFTNIIQIAKELNKPVDGHAPGISGADLQTYFSKGISTDHECFTLEEGRRKAANGVKILIREGSAAKNFQALIPLFSEYSRQLMFCSDDKHPDDLMLGHINQLVKRAVDKGNDLFEVLYASCVHPVEHYKLPVGLLQEGDPADFIIVEDINGWNVLDTIIDGTSVKQVDSLQNTELYCPNQFKIGLKSESDFIIPEENKPVRVIEAIDKELITKSIIMTVPHGAADIDRDLLYITVVNRYAEEPAKLAFIKGFGLKTGAIASSVAHDSHNIVCVGTSTAFLMEAVNLIIENSGGIGLVGHGVKKVLPLPIAGIMSPQPAEVVASLYSELDQLAKKLLGSRLTAPFMTLSFMALLVIPELKLGDKGLFDVKAFELTDLYVN